MDTEEQEKLIRILARCVFDLNERLKRIEHGSNVLHAKAEGAIEAITEAIKKDRERQDG